MIACDDEFLDRTPLSEISPENSFKTASDLETYTNSFYNDLPGFDGIVGRDKLSDNLLYNGVPNEQLGNDYRVVPTSVGSGGWSWGDLRKINIFFKYYQQSNDEDAKKEYAGVAHFFRAYFYYNKLKQFGQVPWYDVVIGSNDVELLIKAKDSREYVTSKIIEDLDLAIEELNTSQSSDRVSKWTALALKSRVCLFEATYRKYRNLEGATELLTLAAEAAQNLIQNGPYKLYSTGNQDKDYRDLFASVDAKEDEVILTRRYDIDLGVVNSVNYALTSPTQDDLGLTKSIVNSYLMKDGQSFTDTPNYETLNFTSEFQNRDPRLAQTIRTPGYKRMDENGDDVGVALLPDFSSSISGYQIVKYLTATSQDGFQAGFQDLPVIRYAEVLLNYAEAKAELGTLTQVDLDMSINLIRDRVGMPALDMIAANANIDAVLENRYANVSGTNKGVILEIRRERRVELVLEGFRYDDLMRWKNGKLLESHFKGMYFSGLGEFDLDGDGISDVELYTGTSTTDATQKIEIGTVLVLSNGSEGNLVPFIDRVKGFNEDRDYLYPIPLDDIQLNPNLEQNPNW